MTGKHPFFSHHFSSFLFSSVSMDARSADQLKRMQLGGNGALNAFLAA